MIKRMDKKLRKEFDNLNEAFFEGRLEFLTVRFTDPKKKLPRDASGAYYPIKKQILIESALKDFSSYVTIVLLHEMIHADLDLRGYIGYPTDGGHGMLFQVELNRLYQAGAYDSLL
jgi:hypothetical protein